MTLLPSFAGLLPRLLLGFCIVHLLWNATDGKSLLVKFFLSAAVGFGVSSLLGFLWIWSGLALAVYAILEGIAAIVLAIWALYKNRAQWFSALHLPKLGDKTDLVWGAVLASGFVLFSLNLALYGLQYPHGRPDAWINWNVAARFVYLGGAEWMNTFLRQLDHPDYPLFMAVTNAITWVFVGEPSTWGPIAFHFVLSLFAAGLLFAFINLLRDFKQAALAAVLFMSLPFIVDQGMRQYADFPLAYLILAAGGLTLLYANTKEKRLALLAGFLAGLAGWTKNEGLVAIVGFTTVWSLIAVRAERSAFKNYILGLTFPLAVTLLFKFFLAPSNDLLAGGEELFGKITDAGRYAIIFKAAGATLWNPGGSPVSLFGLIILYALIRGKTKKRIAGAWTIGSVIVMQLAAYFGIYLATPYDLDWHLNTSLDRLYLHVLPLALLWLFVWIGSPQELSSVLHESA